MTKAWILLLLAGLFECGWAVGLKYTQGFTRLWPSVFTALAMAVSLFLLSRAMRDIPLGTAYAVWTGIGAASVALIGIFFFDEPRNAARLLSLAFIVAGVVGLKVFSAAPVAG